MVDVIRHLLHKVFLFWHLQENGGQPSLKRHFLPMMSDWPRRTTTQCFNILEKIYSAISLLYHIEKILKKLMYQRPQNSLKESKVLSELSKFKFNTYIFSHKIFSFQPCHNGSILWILKQSFNSAILLVSITDCNVNLLTWICINIIIFFCSDFEFFFMCVTYCGELKLCFFFLIFSYFQLFLSCATKSQLNPNKIYSSVYSVDISTFISYFISCY